MTEEAKQEPAYDEENPEVRFVSSDVVPELAYREHRAPILAHELDSRLTGIRRICNRVVVNLSIRIAEDVDVELLSSASKRARCTIYIGKGHSGQGPSIAAVRKVYILSCDFSCLYVSVCAA